MIIPTTELDPKTGRLHQVGRPAQAVYFVLVSYANRMTRLAWPSHDKIAACLGCGVKTVERAIAELEEQGLIKVVRRGGGRQKSGQGISNLIKITPPNPVKSDGVLSPDTPTILTEQLDTSDPEPRQKCPTTPSKVTHKQVKEQGNKQAAASEFTFPLRGRGEWSLPVGRITVYRETFLGLDVEAELRKARLWLIDHPKRRKTASGMPKFLSSWLSRATPVDTARPKGHHHTSSEELDAICPLVVPSEDDFALMAEQFAPQNGATRA
jgi:biotin operon repressor